jgi:alkylated DNA repair protein alkB family protein 8
MNESGQEHKAEREAAAAVCGASAGAGAGAAAFLIARAEHAPAGSGRGSWAAQAALPSAAQVKARVSAALGARSALGGARLLGVEHIVPGVLRIELRGPRAREAAREAVAQLGAQRGLPGDESWVVALERTEAQSILRRGARARARGLVVDAESVGKAKGAGAGEELHEIPLKDKSFRRTSVHVGAHPRVPGLLLLPDFVSAAEEAALLAASCAEWQAPAGRSQPTKRRVRHLGFLFDYSLRRCVVAAQGTEAGMPPWLLSIAARVDASVAQWLRERAGSEGASASDGDAWALNQCTVNEYPAGQGIAGHVDTHSAFADGIASLSLGGGATMRFLPAGDKSAPEDLWLPARSLAVLAGPARYGWTHGIPPRKSDAVEGLGLVARTTRVSLTFRSVLPAPLCEPCPCEALCDLRGFVGGAGGVVKPHEAPASR